MSARLCPATDLGFTIAMPADQLTQRVDELVSAYNALPASRTSGACGTDRFAGKPIYHTLVFAYPDGRRFSLREEQVSDAGATSKPTTCLRVGSTAGWREGSLRATVTRLWAAQRGNTLVRSASRPARTRRASPTSTCRWRMWPRSSTARSTPPQALRRHP
ncbi:MAG: hypothetical protein HZY73_13210 [Micropruina sp.]|nr:MAG: hypothetical protein HZY73_13210 [Micropruina sp.]